MQLTEIESYELLTSILQKALEDLERAPLNKAHRINVEAFKEFLEHIKIGCEPYLNVKSVSEYLDIPCEKVVALLKKGTLPAVHYNNGWWISYTALKQYEKGAKK